jgi:hypothetical protein
VREVVHIHSQEPFHTPHNAFCATVSLHYKEQCRDTAAQISNTDKQAGCCHSAEAAASCATRTTKHHTLVPGVCSALLT